MSPTSEMTRRTGTRSQRDTRPARPPTQRHRLLMMIALMATSAGPARAQVTPAISAPVAQDSTDVPYPEGATGDAVVQLELVVGADGAVASAVVTEGGEPFAEQARRAALTWRFAPALRDQTPVAARIRARVAFQQESRAVAPTAALAPPASATSPTQKAPAPPSLAPAPQPVPEAPLDVTVRGQRREVGQTILSPSDVREMPGAFGDPFRAIEALPGVTPIFSGLPYFYIRGAPPNDNAYTIDGVRVPLLFHVGIGQGVIHPGLMDHVDFFPGAAPADHGGSAGATIAGQTREPATAPRGEANLRILDVGALLESPLDGGRGSALIAGHYGYPGPILGAITSGLTLSYWDYQARATWRIAGRDTLGIFAFGSHDYLATPSPSGDPTARPIEQFVSDFHRLDLRYEHALADGHVRLALTGGHDAQGAAPTYVTETSAALRLRVERGLSPALRLRGGVEARLDVHGFRQNASAGPGDPIVPSTADPPPTNHTGNAHADVVWRVAPGVEIVPGGRLEVFSSSRASAPGSATRVTTTVPAFDPRLAARVTVAPRVAWLTTFGLTHQYPALRASNLPAALVSVPGFPFGVTGCRAPCKLARGSSWRCRRRSSSPPRGFCRAGRGSPI